jgi:CDP-glycerol glycerophosphotransferase
MAKPTPTADAAPSASDLHRKQIVRLEEHQTQRDMADLSRRLRKRPLVLFFGRATFSDNSKYLYLRALAENRGYDVMWCTTSKTLAATLAANGLPCQLISPNDDRSIDLLLHAAVAVFTINPFESVGLSMALLGCLAGAQHVQLWHGVSVKRLNLQLLPHLGARGADIRQYWLANCMADHVLSTTSLLDDYWREVFGCRSLLRAGMPRNEVIVRNAEGLEWLGAELPQRACDALLGSAPVILVVPTWQRGKGTELTDPSFIARTLLFARQHGAQVFYKAHPTYFEQWSASKNDIEGLHLIDPGVDLYPCLHRFDALVTDYSSIMFDYLLTGKPVLTLDLDAQGHRSFEPDYSLAPPGDFRIPFSGDTFIDKATEALGSDQGRQARLDYAARLFETDATQASDSLLKVIDVLVERSQASDHQVWQAGA